MTSINMPRDDAALLIDTKAVADRNVKEVNAYPGVQPVTPHEDVTQAPRRQPHKQKQRRTQERRKAKQKVLLDTRSGHDRRNAVHSASVEIEGDTGTNPTGIDVYS